MADKTRSNCKAYIKKFNDVYISKHKTRFCVSGSMESWRLTLRVLCFWTLWKFSFIKTHYSVVTRVHFSIVDRTSNKTEGTRQITSRRKRKFSPSALEGRLPILLFVITEQPEEGTLRDGIPCATVPLFPVPFPIIPQLTVRETQGWPSLNLWTVFSCPSYIEGDNSHLHHLTRSTLKTHLSVFTRSFISKENYGSVYYGNVFSLNTFNKIFNLSTQYSGF